ncbi:N-acetylmuramoyl-L-alanine amidase [Candidatus Uhrbacteria bacterium]|nr:N-acetylmuramoyl-L-alanine amidase [Candidatus Uhrbacteria bacterium]
MKRHAYIIIALGILLVATVAFSAAAVFAADPPKPIDVELRFPFPGMPNPITLCEPDATGKELVCEGIARYIVNIYRWLIGIIGILAVIALMAGGVQWLMAGGSDKRTTAAKKTISNSLIGLVLALGSYLLLWTISPNLVQLRPLILPIVKEIEVDLEEFRDAVPDPTGGKPHTVKRVILHHSGGSDKEAGCNLVQRTTKKGEKVAVDCHYWVKTDGQVVGPCLDEGIASRFCQGGANTGSIGIEIVGAGRSFTTAQIDSTASLVSKIASKWGVPKDNKAATAEEFRNKGGIFTHASICKLMPGESVGKWDIMEKFQKEIIEKAGGTFHENQPRCS